MRSISLSMVWPMRYAWFKAEFSWPGATTTICGRRPEANDTSRSTSALNMRDDA
jgi:hypothetical protein